MGVQRVSSNSEGPWVLTISTGFHLGFHRISVAMFLGFSGLENPPRHGLKELDLALGQAFWDDPEPCQYEEDSRSRWGLLG